MAETEVQRFLHRFTDKASVVLPALFEDYMRIID